MGQSLSDQTVDAQAFYREGRMTGRELSTQLGSRSEITIPSIVNAPQYYFVPQYNPIQYQPAAACSS